MFSNIKHFFINNYIIFLWIVDSILLFFNKKKLYKSNSVILVRLDNIGDFIIWLSSIDHIKKIFKKKKLILVANKSFAELARDTGYFDQVISIDIKQYVYNIFYRWKILSSIFKLNSEIAINPCYSRNFYLGDSIIRASHSTYRIGSNGDLNNITAWQKTISNRWYTSLNFPPPDLLKELERDAQFIEFLGLKVDKIKLTQLPHFSKLPKNLNINENYFIIFPGASWAGRKWSAMQFSEIGKYISNKYDYKMVICGTQSELIDAENVIHHCSIENAINLAGKTTLSQFCELVRGAKILISNDTSAIHIAPAVNTPSVCLLGGGHFGRFLPYPRNIIGTMPIPVFSKMECYGCNWQCTQSHDKKSPVPCINRISFTDLVPIVDKILSNHRNINTYD